MIFSEMGVAHVFIIFQLKSDAFSVFSVKFPPFSAGAEAGLLKASEALVRLSAMLT